MQAMDACLEPPLLVFGGPYSNLRALDALRQRASKLGIAASPRIWFNPGAIGSLSTTARPTPGSD